VVDGHCFIPNNQLLRNVAECFEKSRADCLGRPQPLDPPGLTNFQTSVAIARGSRLGHGGDSLIYGEYEGFASPVSNGAVYKREVFQKIGYVDETFDAAEDVEFNYRVEKAGLKCYTSPNLTIRYYPREDLRGLLKQMVRYGRGRRRFMRKHPEAMTLNQLVPPVFVVGLCALNLSLLLFVIMGAKMPLILTGIPYVLYVLMVFGESIRVMAQNGLVSGMPIPAILSIIHFGLGWGYLRESLNDLRLGSRTVISGFRPE